MSINIFNKSSIKSKAYLLVFLSVLVALVLSLVSNNGLNAIRIELNKLILSTEIERYTSKLILEEQNYRLHANGSVNNFNVANQSYENAILYVDKIYQILDKIDGSEDRQFSQENLQATQQLIKEYKKHYTNGVSLLTELNKQAGILESEGEYITLRIQEYVESKRREIKKELSQKTIEKINNGSNIWQYTYVTRLNEKKYRLNPTPFVFDAFKKDYQFMTSEWNRLKAMSNQPFELNTLNKFNSASLSYKDAMYQWVDLNNQLVSDVLPQMKALGNSIISNAIQSANQSVKHMSDKRNTIAITSIVISAFTIILGVIFGSKIARSISSPLETLEKQALAISEGKYESSIKVSTKDEVGKLANAFNLMSSAISKEMTGRKHAEEAQRRSQKMEAIGQLTGGIAHDFNNLLGIILGNIELLEEYIEHDKKSIARIKAIEKASLRAAKLTRQLLAFSRQEARQVSVVNINQIINDMREIITRSLTPSIKVQYNLYEDLWETEIDKGDLEDALVNLCLNARDSMGVSGGLTIQTQNVNLDKEYCAHITGLSSGEYIDISITDTGEGIADNMKDRIFEPFYTTKDQGKGTGLGLAMVYAFVMRSHGYIKCDSEMGVGSTFHIYLPKKRLKPSEQNSHNKPINDLLFGTETILAVDDETDLLEIASVMLKSLGYQVIKANDGEQALKQLSQNPEIDLLFSDIVMPNGINGYELAEQATAMRKDLKVLLTSGFTDKAKHQTPQKCCHENLLSKPYRQKELANKVRCTLDAIKLQ
jgi:signal transduction histidine kinase/CheY-like chemotaxis protein